VPPPANSKTLIASSSEIPDDIEDQNLGHGAKAEWKATGFGILDSAGKNDVGKVIIQGAEDRDITVKANFRAVIGPLDKSLPEMTVEIPKDGSVEIPIDMHFALGMNEKQTEYVTRIHGKFTVENETGPVIQYDQCLDPRYLAVNEDTGALKIMDADSQNQKYPHGFTTRKGIEEAEKLASESEKEGAILEGIGPNIVTYANETGNEPK
jgi:hypothetical protein